ncbi:MAG: glutaredoxin family protein [Nitrosomonadales bacterium]|nr:glutaredoxin family protein [Nitrosomonadales bacterium]
MNRIVLLLICLAIMPFGAQAGKLYRWVDTQGKVHYGDTPPADTARVETKKLSDNVTPVEDLPYETRRAQQNFPVTLYVAENCTDPCDQARGLLTKRGIPFSEKKLVTREDIDAFKALSGFDSVPALSVGRIFLKGFQANQWNSELDIAGYPKTAPFRLPVILPVPVTLPASSPAAASGVAPANPAAQ